MRTIERASKCKPSSEAVRDGRLGVFLIQSTVTSRALRCAIVIDVSGPTAKACEILLPLKSGESDLDHPYETGRGWELSD